MGKMDTVPTITQGSGLDYRYGWFKFTPSCLQGLNTAFWFLIFMCFSNIFQSMTINGLVGVVLSSLETRFGLSSAQSSWIASSYDVSTVPVLAVISYFGSRSHRPRWTSAGLFLLVLGTAIFILPHFTTPAYNPGASGDEDDGLCAVRNETEAGGGQGNQASLSGYLAVFILGRVLHGVGAVPLYTIAVTFMDDTVTKEGFSLYIAFFYAAGVLGPALGYIVGGSMLTIFTDFASVDTAAIGLTSSSRNWVGAWWIGFLAGAVTLAIVCIPMFGYPRDLPGAAEVRAAKVSEAYNSGKKEGDTGGGEGEINVSAKDLPRYLLDLLLNPTYVFLTLMVCCDSFIMGGFTAFGPKYVEEQFAVTAALSGMMFGIVVIPGGAGGTIAGGVIVKKMGLKCAGIMKGEMFFSIAIMITALMFIIECNPINFVGVNVGYGNSAPPEEANFVASCNQNCSCASVPFTPICSGNNYQYYSPCHAGCENKIDGSPTNFYNCSCIAETENLTSLSEPAANNNPCTVEGCNLVPLFMVIFFCAMFFLFVCSAMNITATVRCLPSSHRSLGIGVQWIFLRLLGTVPGPLTFGALFDQACEVFSTNEQGGRGQCLLYDKHKMAMYLLAVCVGIKLASLVFIILAWKLYKPPLDSEDEEEEVEEKSKGNVNGVVNTGFEPEVRTLSNGNVHPALNGGPSHQPSESTAF